MGQLPDSKERTDTHRAPVFSLAYSTKAYPLNAGTGSLHSKLYSSTLALSLATRHGRIWTPIRVSQTADLGLSAVWPGTVLAVPGFIGFLKNQNGICFQPTERHKPLVRAACQEPDKLRSLGIIGKSADKRALHAE